MFSLIIYVLIRFKTFVNYVRKIPVYMSLFSEDFYTTVALIYLVLPISNAFCEWRFSAVKHMKNDWQSNLNTETMNH